MPSLSRCPASRCRPDPTIEPSLADGRRVKSLKGAPTQRDLQAIVATKLVPIVAKELQRRRAHPSETNRLSRPASSRHVHDECLRENQEGKTLVQLWPLAVTDLSTSRVGSWLLKRRWVCAGTAQLCSARCLIERELTVAISSPLTFPRVLH